MDEKMETSYETIAEKLKKQLGFKVGILSTVNLNHATGNFIIFSLLSLVRISSPSSSMAFR